MKWERKQVLGLLIFLGLLFLLTLVRYRHAF